MKFLLSFLILFAVPMLAAAEKSKAEVQAEIKKIGSTPPAWFAETPLKYPNPLDLSWPPDPRGPWDLVARTGPEGWDI